MTATIQYLKPVTPAQAKSVKAELKAAGLKVRVQTGRSGSMYIYHNELMGRWTPEEKAIIRDVLVLGGFVTCCGEPYTCPTTRIADGAAIRLPA